MRAIFLNNYIEFNRGKQWQFILTILPKFDIMTTGGRDMFFQNFDSNVYITLKDRISFAKHLHHEIEIRLPQSHWL